MFIPLSLNEVKGFKQGIPCIIVPFRDNPEQSRASQLKQFVSHIHRRHPDWAVLIIEQSDDERKFNRGALLNAGVRIAAASKFEYVIFHDVDLLPLKKIVPYYTAFPAKPIHIGKAWTQKYDFPKFLGGVLSMSMDDIAKTNGFPNQFWGWGGEDDSIRERLRKKKINVYQPTLRGEGYKELTHLDTKTKQEWKNMTKWEDLADDTGRDGVRNVKFDVLKTHEYSSKIVKITVELK
jgi:beta-1,4-galactosyltransferase 4